MSNNLHFIEKIPASNLCRGIKRRINSGIFGEDLQDCGGNKMKAVTLPKWKHQRSRNGSSNDPEMEAQNVAATTKRVMTW